MTINYNRFPGGKPKALTMSYDDGVVQDIRLIEIFNKYGIRGAFHINGGLFGKTALRQRISKDEIAKVYAGHEISLHGYTHQSLSVTPSIRIAEEIYKDRIALESITGEPVRGMSYPNGSVNDEVVNIISSLGVEYCRKVETTGGFSLPSDFLRWSGTTHHKHNLLELGKKFLEITLKWQPYLMYVWGHSYEFDEDNNWNLIEEFCKMMSGKNDIWYATNIEIVDYIKAVRGLKFTADQKTVLNQSMTDVWISVDGVDIKIAACGLTKL
ncbi:MAG: polysaccharide deacetylase family protein [Defluviitaleaceae bacterium]|nr:polysaccharide deacetylase family protein [Defluviitaleaceae bacterium]